MQNQPLIQSKNIYTAFLILICLIGCNDSSTNVKTGISSNQIVPLVVGNQWSLSSYSYDSSNVLQTGSASMLISRDTVIGTQKYYELPIHLLCTIDSIGLRVKSEPSDMVMFKYPAQKGDVFSFYGDTITVGNIDTLITVPAGTFKCVQYDYKSNSTWFISPGIGFVKYEARKLTGSNELSVYYWQTLTNVLLK